MAVLPESVNKDEVNHQDDSRLQLFFPSGAARHHAHALFEKEKHLSHRFPPIFLDDCTEMLVVYILSV